MGEGGGRGRWGRRTKGPLGQNGCHGSRVCTLGSSGLLRVGERGG